VRYSSFLLIFISSIMLKSVLEAIGMNFRELIKFSIEKINYAISQKSWIVLKKV